MLPTRQQTIRAVVVLLAIISLSTLSAADPPPEVAKLIAQLKDPDESVRLKAAKDLGKLKEKAKDALDELRKLAEKDSDEDVRAVAKRAVAAVRGSGGDKDGDKDADKLKEKLAPLIKDLQSKDYKARYAAIATLGEMGAEARPATEALVQFGMMNPNAMLSEAACAAFEKIDPVVYKEVLTLWVDNDGMKRWDALLALRKMGPKAKAGIPVIKAFHDSVVKTNPENKHVTFEVLVAVAPDDVPVQRLVLSLVSGPDRDLPRTPQTSGRAQAIAWMNALSVDNKQKYQALIAGLATAKDGRASLVAEFGKLGADAKAALPALTKLKTDGEAAVREAATKAIEAIKAE